MVALNETASELGPRRVARGCRVAVTYPQGGTGIPAGTTSYLYYTSSWQLIETRTNGTANSDVTSQAVWSAAYINAPVLQDTYSAGVVQPNSRLYFVQDANWNTTAVVGYNATTQTWDVVQRFVYSPYGNIIILNPNFTAAPAGTVPIVNNLYQGMALDPVTGLYYERARWYGPSLGTWISQDPAGYINGANSYQFVMSDPVGSSDPWGLSAYTEHGSISFNPMKAGVLLAPDRRMTMRYTLKFQYFNAGGTPVVGAVTMPATGRPLGVVPITVGQVGFVGGYRLTYSPAVIPLKSTDKCLKIVLLLVKVSAWNFKTFSLHGHVGPIPIPGPSFTVETRLGTVYEKFLIYDDHGNVEVIHQGPSGAPY